MNVAKKREITFKILNNLNKKKFPNKKNNDKIVLETLFSFVTSI